MHRKTHRIIARIITCLTLCFALASPATAAELVALCFHDIQDKNQPHLSNETVTTTTQDLIEFFDWLKFNGYQPVSLKDIQRSKENNDSLPDKPILLTFDDGYESMYSRVFPLLKLYNYPAVLSLVSSWMETPKDSDITYGETRLTRTAFLSWEQVKEMHGSGLVEVASHSHDSHKGISGNAFGNLQPAMTTRRYSTQENRYESSGENQQRIQDDLQQSFEIISKRLQTPVSAITWPYGEYNNIADKIAKDFGARHFLTLNESRNTDPKDNHIHRILVANNTNVQSLAWTIATFASPTHQRVIHADLDYIYDRDPRQMERNLSALLDRILALKANTVFLQAFADPDGDGVASELYFPNRHLPVRADLFNRVAWQIRTRTGAKVYAWMPVIGFNPGIRMNELQLKATHGGHENAYYKRLSPFHPEARQLVRDIYTDLASYAHIDGVLFHDDAFMTDFEDDSTYARQTYEKWGLNPDIKKLRSSPADMANWSRRKTQHLIDFTLELSEILRGYHPRLKTARNIYARVVLQPQAEDWMAQNLDLFIDNYDYTAIMSMPFMENEKESQKWLSTLVDASNPTAKRKSRMIFELQSKDWNTASTINEKILTQQMSLLRGKGIGNYGYYPDDFILGRPDIEKIKSTMSLNKFPY